MRCDAGGIGPQGRRARFDRVHNRFQPCLVQRADQARAIAEGPELRSFRTLIEDEMPRNS
ncbi:hypothetical protein NRB20_52520 [Nocardia sp. RB20]|uniref:Uncharacterized protein n=1 Tax=Nocardia macrotermitis TaxID=2585198 RepID=A0A7K0D962_9NOCA|nr:hypothetical protein [Nocardia macrotermitis]